MIPKGASPSPSDEPSLFRLLLPILVLGATVVAWGAATDGLVLKKTIAMLVLPSGICWLALTMIAAWPGLNKRLRWLTCAAWLVYTVAGNAWLGGVWFGLLERPYVNSAALQKPVDVICVLGGGTQRSPRGEAQLGPAGDRLYAPVKCYREGKCSVLVASGSSITELGDSRDLAAETAAIWTTLGVPESAIVQLPNARNTREEVAAYRDLVAQHPEWSRVAVCTSAWHLSRAEAEWKKLGLAWTPLAADFHGQRRPFSPMDVVPQGGGFQDTHRVAWEVIGRVAALLPF